RRGDSRYTQWDEDLAFYKRSENINSLEKAGTLAEFVDLFKENALPEDYTLVISLEYVNILEDSDEDFFVAFEKLGMTRDEYIKGGKWIFKNGGLTKVHGNDPGAAYIYELSPHDTLSVKFIADGSKENVMINTEDYSNVGSYVDLVVYDNNIEEPVLQKKY
nr:hypothetical protein [Lachnospiraceae bacterium]